MKLLQCQGRPAKVRYLMYDNAYAMSTQPQTLSGTQGHLTSYEFGIQGIYMYLYTFRNIERVVVVEAAAAAVVSTEKLRTGFCSKVINLNGTQSFQLLKLFEIALHMGAYRQNKNSQDE